MLNAAAGVTFWPEVMSRPTRMSAICRIIDSTKPTMLSMRLRIRLLTHG